MNTQAGQAIGRKAGYRLILFDMDGVLIDSRQVIEQAWRSLAAAHGIILTADDCAHKIHGRTGAETVALLFPDHSDAQRAAIWAEVDACEETSPYQAIPGVVALVQALSAAGIALGLVTSSWQAKIRHALSCIGLEQVFQHVVTRDDVSQGKPHPEPYLHGMDCFAVSPQETLIFEDAVSCVCSACAAGADCVGIGDASLQAAGALVNVPNFRGFSLQQQAQGYLLQHRAPAFNLHLCPC